MYAKLVKWDAAIKSSAKTFLIHKISVPLPRLQKLEFWLLSEDSLTIPQRTHRISMAPILAKSNYYNNTSVLIPEKQQQQLALTSSYLFPCWLICHGTVICLAHNRPETSQLILYWYQHIYWSVIPNVLTLISNGFAIFIHWTYSCAEWLKGKMTEVKW